MPDKLSDEILQPVRGARDFFGPEKAKRDKVLEIMKDNFKLYGYEPLETPALERMEVLTSKYAGGDEILKEVFKVRDQGNRELGLRYDLTVPLCRFIASNTRMPMPLKRYAIAPVWRDGPLKAGRYREFCQCDADIVGAAGMIADAEILKLAFDIFQQLFPGNFTIKVNNRKILDGILEYAGVGKENWLKAILIIDKLGKIGEAEVGRELEAAGIAKTAAEKIMKALSIKGENAEVIGKLGQMLDSAIAKEGLAEVLQLMEFASEFECDSVQFEPSLARGLNYYTSSIFEAYLRKGSIASSIAAGGRYDDLIGRFAGGKGLIPAVGISFGLDVICEALRESDRAKAESAKGVFVAYIPKAGDAKEMKFAMKVANMLRRAGIPAYFDLLSRSVSKNLEFAGKKGFAFAAIIGEKEVGKKSIQLKNLVTGKESLLSIEEAIMQINS
ncbi:MAG: histidine--tRNA ligase [Candidatus Micrarchaeota archaeon]